MWRVLFNTVVLCAAVFALAITGYPGTIECDGLHDGGSGNFGGAASCPPRAYMYRITDPNPQAPESIYIGTHDGNISHYHNVCLPPGWSFSISSISTADYSGFTPHGSISPGPNGSCPYLMEFFGPMSPGSVYIGFNHSGRPHDVSWQVYGIAHTSVNWTQAVGNGTGPVHSPLVCDSLGTIYYGDGDCNSDGMGLTISDLICFAQFLHGITAPPSQPYHCDLNGDCVVDIDDITLYQNYFTFGISVFAPYGGYPVPTCCSVNVVVYDTCRIFGLQNVSLGQASLDTAGGVLTVSNIGSSGQDGVSVEIGDALGIDFTFESFADSGIPTGIDLEVRGAFLGSDSDQYLGQVSAVWYDTSGTLLFDFGEWGATSYDLEIYQNDSLVFGTLLDTGVTIRYSKVSNRGSGDPLKGLNVSKPPRDPRVTANMRELVEFIVPGAEPCFGNVITGGWTAGKVGRMKTNISAFSLDSLKITSEKLFLFDLIPVSGLGSSTLTATTESTLVVSNIGSSGNDGVSVDLGRADKWNAEWLPLDSTGTLPNGAYFTVEAIGIANGVDVVSLGEGKAMKTPSGWEVSADYSSSGATTQTVEVYSGGVVVASASGHTGPAAIAARPPNDGHWTASSARIRHGCTGTWKPPVVVTIPGPKSAAVMADSVKIIPDNDTLGHDYMTNVLVKAANIPEIVFTKMSKGPGSCCVGNRGDVNGDGNDANILDLTYLVDRIFRGGPPAPCLREGDTNGDGNSTNILDLTFLVDRIFRGGPAPGSC